MYCEPRLSYKQEGEGKILIFWTVRGYNHQRIRVRTMVFGTARMILKDKGQKALKEDFAPRNRSKVQISRSSVLIV